MKPTSLTKIFRSMPVRSFSKSAISLNQVKGELFKYQDQLPSLPVPELQDTLAKYKKSIAPFYPNGLNDENYLNYCKVIDEFGTSNQGLKLQSKLQSISKTERNWLSKFWDDYAYLDYRDPVSPFVSYFFSHKDLNTFIGKDQILKATVLTYNILKFMESIETESLEPELIKNNPFCMESFRWMFNNCRIPGGSRDLNENFDPSKNRFMVVISNGYFYKLYHHDLNNDSILPIYKIFAGLSEISKTSNDKNKNANPVGILSSSNRDTWFKNYNELLKNPINEISLNDIAKSSFVLCLDDNLPNTIESKSRNCWHGNGYNRWFDKPIQIFVSKNGSSGFLGEHSKMDGTPTLRMNNWLVDQLSKTDLEDIAIDLNDDLQQSAITEELRFEINPTIKTEIENELLTFNKTVNSLDIKVWQYFGFGKNQIKNFKASPDAFLQMLIQLAYYKYTGTVRPTYESASTRKYFAGRTETCRSVSLESLRFVEDWEDTSLSVSEKLKSFRAAVKTHGETIKNASNAYGVDRHLFGLNQMLESQEEKPEIFKNSMYSYSQYWYLSTSQLSSENFNGYGWSPVVPEGFGLAYMINNDWLHINITAFKDNQMNLKADELAYFLTQSVNELKEALLCEQIKSKL